MHSVPHTYVMYDTITCACSNPGFKFKFRKHRKIKFENNVTWKKFSLEAHTFENCSVPSCCVCVCVYITSKTPMPMECNDPALLPLSICLKTFSNKNTNKLFIK